MANDQHRTGSTEADWSERTTTAPPTPEDADPAAGAERAATVREGAGDANTAGGRPTEGTSGSRSWRHQLVDKTVQAVWLVAVIVEVVIGIHVFLHLLAADQHAFFPRLLRTVAAPLLWPFAGLAPMHPLFGGMLDVSALVAMGVYLLTAVLVARLIRILFVWPPRS